MRGAGLLVAAALAVAAPAADRIATDQEIAAATAPSWLLPLRLLSWPHRKFAEGFERGAIAFERHKIRERTDATMAHLAAHGLTLRFGGSGEGAGIGGGALYRIRTGDTHAISMLGLVTVRRYQEFSVNWALEVPAGRVLAEGSYQWRPEENFYGLGHASLRRMHTNFALRQSWAGFRYEFTGARRVRIGALHRVAWMTVLPGHNPLYAAPEVYFGMLPGYGAQTRLQTTGVYLDLDGIRGDYQWGGALHAGASHQRSLGGPGFRYFGYEMQAEARAPVVNGNSALAAQANIELNRPSGGSGPIPFYLLPHIGGSSTLRGFALDRFYGMNLMLLSLEYRYRLHPNVQAIPFFDEGQIFDRTADLSWLNWHRNYGLGFRFRTAAGTFLRVEYGRSDEGFQVHVTFGDRERPPLRGPIRYGAYRR